MPNEETIEHRTVCWMATYTTNYKLDVAALWGEQFILSRAPPASCPARPRRLGPRAMATYGQASPTRLGAAGIYLPTGRRHMLTELACLPARIRICVEPTTRRGTEGALHQAVRPQRSNEPAERAAQAQVPRHPLQLRRVRRVPSWAHVRSSPWHALWPATGTACALPARARARSVLCTLPLPALTTRLTHSILYLSALLHTSDVQLHVHTLPSHRRKFEAARDRRAPQAELLAIQEERIAHRQWWRAERMVSEKVLGEAGESLLAAAELDDKCGSHWCFLPCPGGAGRKPPQPSLVRVLRAAHPSHEGCKCKPCLAMLASRRAPQSTLQLSFSAGAPVTPGCDTLTHSHHPLSARCPLCLADGGREGKLSARQYKYRSAVQVNCWCKQRTMLSLVPPSVRTGANFGCSAFIISLHHMIKSGRITSQTSHVRARASRTRRAASIAAAFCLIKPPYTPSTGLALQLVRQTDGGSDNVGWVAHAFHFALIYFGVANKLTWMRLPPGHSHNGGDRKFSLIKKSIQTQNGAFSPWDLEKAIIEGCKRADGGAEMLWQLANYDFESWMSELVDSKVGGLVASSARTHCTAAASPQTSRDHLLTPPPPACARHAVCRIRAPPQLWRRGRAQGELGTLLGVRVSPGHRRSRRPRLRPHHVQVQPPR